MPKDEPPEHFLTRMPLWATMVLWLLLGVGALVAAMPVSRWILTNSWLASKDAEFGEHIDSLRPRLAGVH